MMTPEDHAALAQALHHRMAQVISGHPAAHHDGSAIGDLGSAIGGLAHTVAHGVGEAAHAVAGLPHKLGQMSHENNVTMQGQFLAKDLRKRGIPDSIAWAAADRYAKEMDIHTPHQEDLAVPILAAILRAQMHQHPADSRMMPVAAPAPQGMPMIQPPTPPPGLSPVQAAQQANPLQQQGGQ